MEVKLLRTSIQGIKIFESNCLEFDFFTRKKVKEEEVYEHIVEHLFSSIYKQNVIALAGINASGKTTTLKFILMALELFIQNKSLDSLSNAEILDHVQDTCTFVNTFYYNKKVYNLKSIITRSENGDFEFVSEELKNKTASENLSKEKLFAFDAIETYRTRAEIEEMAMGFLRSDTSIFMQVLKEAGILSRKQRFVYDMTKYTNFNTFNTLHQIPTEYIQYLDPDIESIRFINNTEAINVTKQVVQIKFFNQEIKEITLADLWKYLSSGTIKGLNLLLAIEGVLKNGGYMVIDELENHLNKTAVITIINLFKSELNRGNATLIFSTHYSEILDDIERNDSIYFSTKSRGNICLTNLATEINRADKKKSNVFLSGLLGTAPKYSAYKKLKNSLNIKIKNSIDEEGKI